MVQTYADLYMENAGRTAAVAIDEDEPRVIA
jgi:hypothetical protein